MEIRHTHALPTEDARARLQALGAYFEHRHGLKVRWPNEDRCEVQGRYKLVPIEVAVSLMPGAVQMSGKDPGMLLRAAAEKYLKNKLAAYLDPSRSVAELPRA